MLTTLDNKLFRSLNVKSHMENRQCAGVLGTPWFSQFLAIYILCVHVYFSLCALVIYHGDMIWDLIGSCYHGLWFLCGFCCSYWQRDTHLTYTILYPIISFLYYSKKNTICPIASATSYVSSLHLLHLYMLCLPAVSVHLEWKLLVFYHRKCCLWL